MTKIAFFALALTLGCGPTGGSNGAPTLVGSTSGPDDAVIAALSASASSSASSPGVPAAGVDDRAKIAFDEADLIVKGKIESAKLVAVLEVDPPIFVHELDIVVEQRLAGGATPARIHVHFSSRDVPNAFEQGKPALIAMHRVQSTLPSASERFEASWISAPSAALEELAKGRSALPEGLTWSVAQVAPSKPIKYQNDYGDGSFELTLKNETAKPIEVRGLMEKNGIVAWENALTLRDRAGRTLRMPSASLAADAKPVVLAPGAKISTVVDVKPFGLGRPVGADRIYYSFGLGDLRTSSFFYYSDNLHQALMGPKP